MPVDPERLGDAVWRLTLGSQHDDLLPHPGVNHWTANPKSSCILTQNTNSLKLYWHLFVVHFIAKNLANSFEFDITRPIELYANNYNKPLTPPFSG
jgi:hypothetical protein